LSLAWAVSDDEGHAMCEALQIAGVGIRGNVRLSASKARLTGDSPMKKFIFVALTVTTVISAAASGAFQQAPQAQLTEDGAAGWSIAESGAAPAWSITPAHARMW
jgi:hypothetical protein